MWLALGAALLSWFVALLWWAMLPSTSTVEVTIPAGTSELVAAGEIVEVLPAKLSLRVGDDLFIRNHDTAVHRIGPAFVPPGEALSIPVTRSFFDAATLVCSFHPSGGLPVVPLARPHVLTTIPIGLMAGIPLALAAVVTASITARLNTEEPASEESEDDSGTSEA